jgi:hypothetical protein
MIRQIISRRMKWAGHVVHMGEWRKCTRLWWESQKGDRSEDQGIIGRIGTGGILRRLAGGCVEWIQLAPHRDRWLAVVNTVMNLWVLAPCIYLVRRFQI